MRTTQRTGQLKMFMSAPEIVSEWSPLDADRAFRNNREVNRLKDEGAIDRDEWYRRSVETDDQVWSRKADEWDDGREGRPSSAEDVVRQGVIYPISLSHQFGVMDRPQVAGGHHRIAAHLRLGSDKLMPVIHHETVADARNWKGYT